MAVRSVDGLAFAVAVALDQDAEGTVFLVDPPDLGGDEVGGLIPGDPLVFALAAVLRCSCRPSDPSPPSSWGT